jgi:GNAT superfamily N-acetyltransferase
MPDPWRVERVDEDGWRELRELRLAALQADPSAFASTLERELAMPEEGWRAWARASACFVAWADDGGSERAIGLAVGAGRQNAAEAELAALWVHPEHRELMVGEALVRAVIEWARAGNRLRLNLWVTAGSPAVEFCERLGFVAAGPRRPLSRDPQLTEVEYALSLS